MASGHSCCCRWKAYELNQVTASNCQMLDHRPPGQLGHGLLPSLTDETVQCACLSTVHSNCPGPSAPLPGLHMLALSHSHSQIWKNWQSLKLEKKLLWQSSRRKLGGCQNGLITCCWSGSGSGRHWCHCFYSLWCSVIVNTKGNRKWTFLNITAAECVFIFDWVYTFWSISVIREPP